MDLWEFAAQQAREGPQEPPEAQQGADAPPALRIEQERRRGAEAGAMAVYREYQENTKKSTAAQAAILKGIQTGANPYRLLLTACECIAAMTGNRDFATMAKTAIVEISGAGLNDPAALEIELDDVRARLAMLQRPELEPTPGIRRAIIEHERRELEIIEAQRSGKTILHPRQNCTDTPAKVYQ